MAVITGRRDITFDEAVHEMDRRGKVIENLERDLNIAFEALNNISSVPIDFGHLEDAARTMKEHAKNALNNTSW